MALLLPDGLSGWHFCSEKVHRKFNRLSFETAGSMKNKQQGGWLCQTKEIRAAVNKVAVNKVAAAVVAKVAVAVKVAVVAKVAAAVNKAAAAVVDAAAVAKLAVTA